MKKLSKRIKEQWKNQNNDEQLNSFINDILPEIETMETSIELLNFVNNTAKETIEEQSNLLKSWEIEYCLLNKKYEKMMNDYSNYMKKQKETLNNKKIERRVYNMDFSKDFSEALIEMKNGELVKREGWNGKNMYLFIVKGFVVENAIGDYYKDCNKLPVCDAIYMKTADNKLVPWLASQSDLLSNDWVVFRFKK